MTDDRVILKLRGGRMFELPRSEAGMTDFSSVNPCPRCETEPRQDGSLPSTGGFLRVYAIHKGIWTAYVAACSCIYGTWRTVTRGSGQDGIPGLRYADDIPGVPPGLGNADWTLLNLYKAAGDDYWMAVCRIPETCERRDDLRRMIENWEHAREECHA